MINIGETIKELRTKYNLSQSQLAKAVFVEPATISMWENSKRLPDYETIEQVLNVFGYTLDIKLIGKPGARRNEDFYMPKAYKQIAEMSKEDLVDYIYITQDDFVIGNICGLDSKCTDIVSMLPLDKLKDLISKRVEESDRLTIYFKLEHKYQGVEKKVVDFMKEIRTRLQRIALTKLSIVKQIQYVDIDIDYLENGCFYFSDIKFLDVSLRALDISMEEINTDNLGNYLPLDTCLDNPYKIGFSVQMMYLYPRTFLTV